jgi:SAM-dependent methyltransferase
VATKVLWPELIDTWEIPPRWVRYFDIREGTKCEKCNASLRARQLARAVIHAGYKLCRAAADDLAQLTVHAGFSRLHLAEINSAGGLHRHLRKLPELRYSEYGSSRPHVPSEDLMALSYPSASFDLVITSETLEHVPDLPAALAEIRRVLRPNGYHVFTVPVVWDRPSSRTRARLEAGRVVHDLPPSYHGMPGEVSPDQLVFHEFGGDFPHLCANAGFEVLTMRDRDNPALSAFIARRLP